MGSVQALSASLEDYLEAIFHIVAEKKVARAKEIAEALQVSRPSVTGALHALAERGLVNYAPYEIITLTDAGRTAAEDVIRRHETLYDFFVEVLAVDRAAAQEAACRMEHAVPAAVLERLVRFVEFVGICPRCGREWVRKFEERCDYGRVQEECEQCLQTCMRDFNDRRERREEGRG